MTRVLLIFLLSIVSFQIYAQTELQGKEYCGTIGVDEEWEAFKREYSGQFLNSRNCEYNIPLTIHILGEDNGVGYHPLSSIFGSLQTLNDDFSGTGINFFIAGEINFINNSSWYDHESFGTGAQMMIANNVENTINCYIVQNAAGNCGYRSFSGDAVALAKSCTQPKDHTWAHEIGHWLSLPHTFSGWEGIDYDADEVTPTRVGSRQVELVDGSNCSSASDRICDTPSDYLSFRWACDQNGEYPDSLADPQGLKFAVDGSLFMSYAFDACQNRFSLGQIDEMCDYVQNFVPEIISTDTPPDPIDPSQTELIYPINGEVVEGAVTLEWEENGNASIYVVEVSRFSNMGILSFRGMTTGTSLDVSSLSNGKSYFWRVRTLNEYSFDYNLRTDAENFETGNLSSTEDYYIENLRIYPNPVNKGSSVYMNLDSQVGEDVSISIIAMDGQTFYTQKHFIRNGSNKIELDVANLPSGMYILSGLGELHQFQKKLIIE